jgi:hypothetical protein
VNTGCTLGKVANPLCTCESSLQVILATKEEVAAARAVVEALVYDPCIGGVSNPVLNRHYEVLEVSHPTYPAMCLNLTWYVPNCLRVCWV